ncbi:hypothetical protein T4B_9585 [Trichinella pseudospiralis]|uniref:Uncharacterized protein n=1 Tax=Trichinella pseudospiralis TaxID=6337 RepID=A0A0V1GFQ2_TRIPS|nr:hypothetical protein T4B_9585 [Trichinella pseudospiralis]
MNAIMNSENVSQRYHSPLTSETGFYWIGPFTC